MCHSCERKENMDTDRLPKIMVFMKKVSVHSIINVWRVVVDLSHCLEYCTFLTKRVDH